MCNLDILSHEIMVYMRGKYCLDEIGDSKDELFLEEKNVNALKSKKMYFQSIFVIYMKIRKHIMMANGCLSIYLL